MIDRNGIEQKMDEIIDIADWEIHPEYEVFPEGARDKSLLICPASPPFDFCLSGLYQ